MKDLLACAYGLSSRSFGSELGVMALAWQQIFSNYIECAHISPLVPSAKRILGQTLPDNTIEIPEDRVLISARLVAVPGAPETTWQYVDKAGLILCQRGTDTRVFVRMIGYILQQPPAPPKRPAHIVEVEVGGSYDSLAHTGFEIGMWCNILIDTERGEFLK